MPPFTRVYFWVVRLPLSPTTSIELICHGKLGRAAHAKW